MVASIIIFGSLILVAVVLATLYLRRKIRQDCNSIGDRMVRALTVVNSKGCPFISVQSRIEDIEKEVNRATATAQDVQDKIAMTKTPQDKPKREPVSIQRITGARVGEF